MPTITVAMDTMMATEASLVTRCNQWQQRVNNGLNNGFWRVLKILAIMTPTSSMNVGNSWPGGPNVAGGLLEASQRLLEASWRLLEAFRGCS